METRRRVTADSTGGWAFVFELDVLELEFVELREGWGGVLLTLLGGPREDI